MIFSFVSIQFPETIDKKISFSVFSDLHRRRCRLQLDAIPLTSIIVAVAIVVALISLDLNNQCGLIENVVSFISVRSTVDRIIFSCSWHVFCVPTLFFPKRNSAKLMRFVHVRECM